MEKKEDVFKEIWDREPCLNPLEPVQWEWKLKSVKGNLAYVLTCINNLYRSYVLRK